MRDLLRNVLSVFNPSTMMTAKKSPIKRSREPSERIGELAEVALAAIVSYKKQKEVSDFINYLLEALERNSNWLNNVVGKQSSFRCALLVGAGPNRFQVQEIIYPSGDNEIKLEVELKDSEDHDKIAVAALLKMTNADIDSLLKYIKTNMFENPMLKQDLLRGKGLGINFAVLRPITDKQYRVMERIVIGSSTKCAVASKKRKDEKLFQGPPIKKTKKIFI